MTIDLETATERQLLIALIKGQENIMSQFSDLKDAETAEAGKIDALILAFQTISTNNTTLVGLVAQLQSQVALLQSQVPTAEDIANLQATASDIATESAKIDAALNPTP